MNCSAIQDKLPAYFIDNLDSRVKLTVERHLDGCSECRTFLARLYQVDNTLQVAVKGKMASLIPSRNAWSTISARLPSPSSRSTRDLRISRIALVTAVILFLALLLVPPVYARLEKIISGWLMIQVPSSGTTVTIDNFRAFTPYIPTSLPQGFDLTTTGTHTSPDEEELQLIYARGEDIFLLVQRNPEHPAVATDGYTVDLGDVKGILLDPAAEIDEQYRAIFPDGTIRLLNWNQDGILISLYSNMPAEDMLRFARSMQPAQR